jgi:hypothetical protein
MEVFCDRWGFVELTPIKRNIGLYCRDIETLDSSIGGYVTLLHSAVMKDVLRVPELRHRLVH